MRRIKMIMGMAVVLVGMLALNAGPAMADEVDGGTTTLDELCSPGLPDGFFIPGCIFSDSIEADDADDEEVVFFVDDNDFDFNDDDFNDDDFDHGDFDFDDSDVDVDVDVDNDSDRNNNGGKGGRN